MSKLFLIILLVFCISLGAGEKTEYNLSFDLVENGVFIFSLEGSGQASLKAGSLNIPIFKGSRTLRRYVFHINSQDVLLSLSDSLSLVDMDYRTIDSIPFYEKFIFLPDGEMEKDFIIYDPLKKIMNEIHYLSFRVYNLQKGAQLSLFINNIFYSTIPITGVDRWSDRIIINVFPYLERNQIADIISFEVRDEYGIDSNIGIRDLEFSRGFILPDNAVRGYILPHNLDNPNFIIFQYDDYNPDLYLSFYLYNNTEDNPVEIEFNNNTVKTIRGKSGENEWSELINVKIPEWMVIRGSNTILVKNLYNMESNLKKQWGIKNLYQSREIGSGAQGLFSRDFHINSFADRVVYSLKEIKDNMSLNFRLFNIRGDNKVSIILGGRKIKEYSNITEEEKWSDLLTLDIEEEYIDHHPEENTLVFMRENTGKDWGIDLEKAFYREELGRLIITSVEEEIPIETPSIEETQEPEQEEEPIKETIEYHDPFAEAIERANYEIKQDIQEAFEDPVERPEPIEFDDTDIYDESGSIFSFETVPNEAMIFVGGNPLYPGRFIGYTPFSQDINIPARTYIFVHSPNYGSNIFFHNPVYDFPLYNYYFNLKNIRQFVDTPRIYDIFMSMPVDYNILNTAPFYCDYNKDGFNNLIVGTADGDLLIMKREEIYDFTQVIEILEIEGSSYIVPFLLDYNNDGKTEILIGNLEGEILLYKKNEEGEYVFDGLILKEALQSYRFEGTAPFVFDLNNNNKKDIIFGTSYDGIYYSFNTGSDSNPVFESISKIELPVEDPLNAVPAVFYNYRDGSYSVIVGTRDGSLLMLQSPKIVDNELIFDNISLLSSPETLNLGFDLVPRVLDYDNNGSHEILIGNRAGEVIIVKYENKE